MSKVQGGDIAIRPSDADRLDVTVNLGQFGKVEIKLTLSRCAKSRVLAARLESVGCGVPGAPSINFVASNMLYDLWESLNAQLHQHE